MKLEYMIGHISASFPNCMLQVDIQTKDKLADFNTKARYVIAPSQAQIGGIGLGPMKFDDVTQWVIAYRESPT